MNCLGVDFGTTSVKSALYNEKLEQLFSTCEEYTLKASGDTVELEAQKYWDLMQNVLSRVGAEHSIDCLAIDTQCETLVLCDEEGNPLRDAIVWLDNRATEEAAIIEAHFGKKRIYEVTGQPEVTATWPACLGSAILAGVGAGVFESVEQAAAGIQTDKVYIPDGTDYTEVYQRFEHFDRLLNI